MATARKTSTKKSTARKSSTKKASATKAGGAKKASATIRCGKWTAYHDFMPPRTPTLRVTGECTTPTPGYRIRLEPAVPQGINPKILLLNKIVTPPTGPRPQVLSKVEVRYSKRTRTEYTSVTILPDGVTIRVKKVS